MSPMQNQIITWVFALKGKAVNVIRLFLYLRFYMFLINYRYCLHTVIISSSMVMCVCRSVIRQTKLLEMSKGHKEQIGSLHGQNVGLKVHNIKPIYFIWGKTPEAPPQFLFI